MKDTNYYSDNYEMLIDEIDAYLEDLEFAIEMDYLNGDVCRNTTFVIGLLGLLIVPLIPLIRFTIVG